MNKGVTVPAGVEALREMIQDPEDAWFTEKGPEKSSVQFQHRGLAAREGTHSTSWITEGA